MELLHGLEVGVLHGILRSDALSVVVLEHLAEQVESLLTNEVLVGAAHKLVPGLLRMLAEDVVVMSIECYVVLVDVCKELVSAEYLGDLDELVIVVLALEERLLLEDHAREHAPKRPNVERVIVGLQVDEELGALEIAGGDSYVVLLAGVVKLGEAPIDKAQFTVGVVNHDVVGLHISVGDALRVAVVERAKHLKDIVSDIEICEALVESAEVDIAGVNILHDKRGRFGHWIADDVNQVDDVDTALESLQNFDLTSDLGLLHRLEDLDNDALTIGRVDSLVDLRVLASSDFLDNFVVLLRPVKLTNDCKSFENSKKCLKFGVWAEPERYDLKTYPNLTSKFS